VKKRLGGLYFGRPFLCLFDAETTTVEQISLLKLICSKNDRLFYLTVLPIGYLLLVSESINKVESVKQTERSFGRLQDIRYWNEELLPHY